MKVSDILCQIIAQNERRLEIYEGLQKSNPPAASEGEVIDIRVSLLKARLRLAYYEETRTVLPE
jgi:hypothetical protein